MGGRISKSLKQAYRLVRERKSLWLAGLFLVWPHLLVGSAVTYFLLGALGPVGDGGVSYSPPQASEGDPVVGAVSIAAIILLAVLYFRFRAYVSLIARGSRDQKEVDPARLWVQTRSSLWPLASMAMAYFSFAVVFLTGVSIPVMNLARHGQDGRALALAVIGVALFAPVLAVFYLAVVTSPIFLAGYGLSPWDSFRASLDLVRKLWRGLIRFALVMLAVNAAGLAVSIAAAAAVVAPFVLLGGVFYDMDSGSGLTALQALAGILGFMVFFISQALVSVYARTAWSVLFFEVIRPVRKRERGAESTQSAPETAPAE